MKMLNSVKSILRLDIVVILKEFSLTTTLFLALVYSGADYGPNMCGYVRFKNVYLQEC